MTARIDERQRKRETRSSFLTRLFVVVVAIMWLPTPVVLFQVLEVGSDVQTTADTIKDQTTAIRETQKSSRAVIEFINDCTQPTGQCYQQSQASQAAQAGEFNAAVFAAARCTVLAIQAGDEDGSEVQECIGRILDGRHHPGKGKP